MNTAKTAALELLTLLNGAYPLNFDRLEQLRDGGSTAYAAYAGAEKYFLRVTKPAFYETVKQSVAIQLYLENSGIAVPPVVNTSGGSPFSEAGDGKLCILYKFIDGCEADPEADAEKLGELTGKLHRAMRDCPIPLVSRGYDYYIGRYIGILRRKKYAGADKFAALGEALWSRVKALPHGACHGDLYRGNLMKSGDKLYLLDFDTFCDGFPLYDIALICNMTDYFRIEPDGFAKNKAVLERILPEYVRNGGSPADESSVYELIAVYHFALQATIFEMYGINAADNCFFDRQLEWLNDWISRYEH